MWLGADKVSFKGLFANSGSAQVNDLPRKSGAPSVDLDLQLEAGPSISGVVKFSDVTLPFVALTPELGAASTVHTAAFVPLAGAAYSGYGYITLSADSKGGAKIAGKLADGSKIAASSVISDGQFDGLPTQKLVPVFIPLGKAQGVLTGEVQIDKEDPSEGVSVDDGGQDWGWVKPGSSTVAKLAVKGRRLASARGISILTTTVEVGEFSVSGALPSGAALRGLWPGSNKPSFADKNFKLAFSAKSGAIKGSIKNPKTSYEGIMFSSPISLEPGAPAVNGAGFRLDGQGSSLPVRVSEIVP